MTTIKCTMCDTLINYVPYKFIPCTECAGTGRSLTTDTACTFCIGSGFHTELNPLPMCTKCDAALTKSCRTSLAALGVY